jgi:uncharacterized protein YunC (DUF1805 family)
MVAKARAHLTRTEILKVKTKELEVDGGLVTICALSASYAISLRGKTLGDAEIFDMLSKSLVAPELTPEEVGTLPITTVEQIVKGVMSFNSMSEGAVVEATNKLKKPPSDSTTASSEP